MATPMTGAASSGTNRAMVQRMASADGDDGEGDPGATDDAAQPQAPSMRDERGADGVERRIQRRRQHGPRIGRDHDRRRRRRRLGGARRHEAPPSDRCSRRVLPATARRASKMRKRRVGDTAWTERSRKMTDRMSQVATLFGHSVSRPLASAGAAGSSRDDDDRRRPRRRRSCRCPRPASGRERRSAPPPGTNPPSPFSTKTTAALVGARVWTPEHHIPPNVASVPHRTSAWARNGLM